MSKVVELVTDLVNQITIESTIQLVDVEFVKEGKSWFLRVFVDTPEGIDIDECAWLSEKLSDSLDQITPDPIPQAYFLEVSSPGAERVLKTEEDVQHAVGKYVHASFYQQIAGEKYLEGTLEKVTPDEIILQVKDKTRRKQVNIERKNIAKLRLAIEF
ncbi:MULTISPECIES: ribosome maturation factor RimP [unclassified Granulicatella]|uniref:ribosome maturation factor RimP n=1 Tax=unclassified Granulicatella TaxID=2630493 RepID=UPI0010730021|nr:ribosome maturation factor RimP [Granulicatella sp. WM01]MBF0781082.1 ribosome maturation factor RimP [Granulicatella sp. 19428wC4_WM01]TFU92142.1 ribosome maturation factor RimP [Granulicatella sp. WM01]